jgi:hypothetical protein
MEDQTIYYITSDKEVISTTIMEFIEQLKFNSGKGTEEEPFFLDIGMDLLKKMIEEARDDRYIIRDREGLIGEFLLLNKKDIIEDEKNIITFYVDTKKFITTMHTLKKCEYFCKCLKLIDNINDLYIERCPYKFDKILSFLRNPMKKLTNDLIPELIFFGIDTIDLKTNQLSDIWRIFHELFSIDGNNFILEQNYHGEETNKLEIKMSDLLFYLMIGLSSKECKIFLLKIGFDEVSQKQEIAYLNCTYGKRLDTQVKYYNHVERYSSGSMSVTIKYSPKDIIDKNNYPDISFDDNMGTLCNKETYDYFIKNSEKKYEYVIFGDKKIFRNNIFSTIGQFFYGMKPDTSHYNIISSIDGERIFKVMKNMNDNEYSIWEYKNPFLEIKYKTEFYFENQ